MKYVITDWANNLMFNGEVFNSFEDAWEHIYTNISDEDAYQDICVVEYPHYKKYQLV
jgi:hypothetical protein